MSAVGSQFGSMMSSKVYFGFGGAVGSGSGLAGVDDGETGATGAFGPTGAGLPGDDEFSPLLKLMHPAGILTFGPGTGQIGVLTFSQTYLF